MANKDIQNEMELLRKQLEEMKREREAEQATAAAAAKKQTVKDSSVKKKAGSQHTEAAEEAETATNAAADNDSTDILEDIVTQIKGLLESLENDINDSKPTALLAAFALGVLVGRL